MKNNKQNAKAPDSSQDPGSGCEDFFRATMDAVLDHQKRAWTSFRQMAATQLTNDSGSQAVREMTKLMMSSFLEFAGTERDMRKRFLELQVSLADRQLAFLDAHRRASSPGAKPTSGESTEKEEP